MLRIISAALVATALVAGTAFAAQPSASTGAATAIAPGSTTVQAPVKQTAVKPVSKVKHASARRQHHAVHTAKPGMSRTVKSPA